MFENVSGMAAERLVGKRCRRSWAGGADALPQIGLTLHHIEVYSAWMGGCLQ
jgi:hypothetical protein